VTGFGIYGGGRAYSTRERDECIQGVSGKVRRGHYYDLDVSGRIILKWDLVK
jgi:hypothetical protein